MPSREKPASRPPRGHWEPAAPYHVSPVFPAAVLTVPDKEPSETYVVVVACSHLPGSGADDTGKSTDSAECVEKTQNAIKVLKRIETYVDAEKAKDLVGIRPGKGKMRNQRYISRKGPLIVYGTEGAKLVKAFRNIPGVEIANVERLNLLKLTPGGHLGRFIIWTKSAFEKLDSIYGSLGKTWRMNGICLKLKRIFYLRF